MARAPLTGTAGRHGSRLLPAAALVAAALLACFAVAAPHADGQLGAAVSTDAADPTALREVPFDLAFDRKINASTLEASDIDATSGMVRNLRDAWPHGADIGSHGSGPDQLNTPHGVAVNASGHVYVADTLNHRVSVFNKTGHNVGHIGNSSTFTHPHDVAVGGPHGRVYVADTDNDRVRVFDSEWEHVHDIDYTTPGNQFGIPSGVAVDSSGNAYVADRGTHRVYVFNHTWQYVRDVGDSYDQPNGIAVDSSGSAYVADSNNNRVRVYDAAGQRVDDIYNSFSYPFAVDVDPAGNVFVADANNNRVQVFDSARQHVAHLTRSFSVVTGVGVDPATGDVYASGRNNHRVTLFDAARAFKFDVADPDNGRTLTVGLPAGRVQDLEGSANAESDAASIRAERGPTPSVSTGHGDATGAETVGFLLRFDEAVNASTLDASDIAVSSGTVQNLRFAPARGAEIGAGLLDDPSGVAVDAEGGIYVADRGSGLVRIFNRTGDYAGAIPVAGPRGVAIGAGSGSIYASEWNGSDRRISVFDPAGNRNGSITIDGLSYRPEGVAVDAEGRVYAANSLTGGIIIFSPSRGYVGQIATGAGLASSLGVAVDASGNIYAASSGNDRIRIFDSSRDFVADITNSFDKPTGVAVDAAGAIYVADEEAGRVQVFNSSRGYAGDLPGPFDGPYAVAVDGQSGAIYVAEKGGDAVRSNHV